MSELRISENLKPKSKLRGSLLEAQPSQPSLLRGSLLDKSARTETASSSEVYSTAITLETGNDEDGPPISKQKRIGENMVTLIGVTDGLGGSGARYYESTTGAHLGSKAVSEAVSGALDVLEATDLDTIKKTLTKQIEAKINAITAKTTSELRGSILADFPTTLSAVLIVEGTESTKIIACWVGDSPIIVQTETGLYTTIEPGSGDAPTDKIHKGAEVNLNSAEFEIAAGSAVRVITSTDALVKTHSDELTSAVDFLDRANISTATDAIATERNLKAAHQKTGDDFTIAVAGSKEPVNQSFSSQMRTAKSIQNGGSYRA